jgi:hypothetical protein
VVEEAIDQGYRLLRGALVPRLRERTRIELELPDVPLARIAVATTPDALALDVFTTLPVRAGVVPAPPAPPGAILVQIAGETATRAANRRLEHTDGPIVLELLARTKALVERSTSSKRRGPGSLRITVGGREVTTRLVRAEVAGDELRAEVAVEIAGGVV